VSRLFPFLEQSSAMVVGKTNVWTTDIMMKRSEYDNWGFKVSVPSESRQKHFLNPNFSCG
jgi:hypothetical protein